MKITKNKSDIARSEQVVLNGSVDDDFDVIVVEGLEYNPASTPTLERKITENLAVRTDSATTANVTYVGKAAIGSATSSAVWQVQKVDETTTNTAIITWADGNSNFDNIWDNRASLSYS